MPKPGNKSRRPEDELIAVILKVKPTADMLKYPERKADKKARKKGL